jgi:hypothetical protein
MKKKLCVNWFGGLGNLMFQAAAGYSLSLRDNLEFSVDTRNYHGGKYGYVRYLDNIFRKIQICNTFDCDNVFGEQGHDYHEIPRITKDTKLNGYFQTEKYFQNFRNEILELFSPTEEITQKLEDNYQDILSKKNVSIHIRRGDYLDLKDYYQQLTLDYYKKATDLFGDEYCYVIFSDDIQWCKENFGFLNEIVFIEDLEDYEQIYLMSMCDNNIISNSTFGWWGAWMNMNPDKKVVGPDVWFGPKLVNQLNSKDIICNNWIKI